MKRSALAPVVLMLTGTLLTGCGLLASLNPFGSSPPQTVYTTDFEQGAGPEWTSQQTDTTPIGARTFLGQFSNDTISLNLKDLPPHQQVTVSFDLFIIRSWEGNATLDQFGRAAGPDLWELSVEDQSPLLKTTFSNVDFLEGLNRQAYPDSWPGGQDHPARTGAKENNSLGFTTKFQEPYVTTRTMDAVYGLSFTFAHSGDDLMLNFSAFGLQAITDESWGLDNIRVRVQ